MNGCDLENVAGEICYSGHVSICWEITSNGVMSEACGRRAVVGHGVADVDMEKGTFSMVEAKFVGGVEPWPFRYNVWYPITYLDP